MTSVSIGPHRMASMLLFCSAIAGCAATPESVRNVALVPTPVPYHADQARVVELTRFTDYLSTLSAAQADGRDVAQLQYIQRRDVGERVRVVATTSTRSTCILMPAIAAVTPPVAASESVARVTATGGRFFIVAGSSFQPRMSSFRGC